MELIAIVGAVLQSAWKWVLIVAGIVGLLWGLGAFLNPSDPLAKADAIVAISGGDTKARAQAAIDLYKDGWAPKIIFSGAALDPLSPSNARVMREQAVRSGIPSSAVIIEEAARDTAQNAIRSQKLINELKAERVILVTSGYHQRRASIEFNEAVGGNVEIINYSAEDKSWPERWWLTPRGWWLALSELVKITIIWIRIQV